MEASTSSATIARQTWEIENNIVAMETPAAAAASDSDAIFEYDADSQTSIQQQKPWTRDPHFFKNVRISALALLKLNLLMIRWLWEGIGIGFALIVLPKVGVPKYEQCLQTASIIRSA